MSREYYIDDALGQRRIAETELPLSIGGRQHGGIVLPGAPAEQLFAYLALSQGHIYLQPAGQESVVFLNDEQLSDSAWLKSGDQIQVGESLIQWTVKGDKVLLDVLRQTDTQSLKPPLQAPPDRPPAVSNELPVHTRKASPGNTTKRTRLYIYAVVGLLLLAAGFLLVATPVIIKLQPTAQSINMKGFPPPLHLWGSRLALPGNYIIEADHPGYAPLREPVAISIGETGTFSYTLSELPGVLQITTEPTTAFKLQLDALEIDADESGQAKISRGAHQLRILAPRYLPHEQTIEIKGYGEIQSLHVKLQPAWENVTINSQPAMAEVRVDGELIGQTPLSTQILQGQHKIELYLPDYKVIETREDFIAGQNRALAPFELQPVDGHLSITSQPADASISLDGIFKGTTPLKVAITANVEHKLKLSKSGYTTAEKTIQLKPKETQKLNIRLQALYATVFLSSSPAGASLQIDGKPRDKQNGHFKLTAHPHTFTLSKPGYVSQTLNISPQPGSSQSIEIKLETPKQKLVQTRRLAMPPTTSSPDGQKLKLIKAGSSFSMGASRREAGRRANESRRLVELKRPFYLASKETSNREYRLFQSAHNSGSIDGAQLDGDSQPVVNISWDDAARYCNWLSQKQGLPASYVEKNGKMIAVQAMTTGYRLPTEAEWAWVARRQGRSTEQRYPWAGSYPPEKISGNYADARIADTLADIVPDYDDGYRGTAAVGSFPARPEGMYDLGGNVSEWMHDYYALYPGEATQLVTDPSGPISGTHYVVRGAGWRHGNITELRLSYRDYSNKPRHDLGFRIARYAE